MTLDHVPFAKLLGIEVDSVEPGHAVLSMKLRDDLMRNNGIAHGGAIATLIDSAASCAGWATSTPPENMRGTTVALNVSYLAAADQTDLRAEAKVLRRGKMLSFIDVDVTNGEGKLVAKGSATYKLG